MSAHIVSSFDQDLEAGDDLGGHDFRLPQPTRPVT